MLNSLFDVRQRKILKMKLVVALVLIGFLSACDSVRVSGRSSDLPEVQPETQSETQPETQPESQGTGQNVSQSDTTANPDPDVNEPAVDEAVVEETVAEEVVEEIATEAVVEETVAEEVVEQGGSEAAAPDQVEDASDVSDQSGSGQESQEQSTVEQTEQPEEQQPEEQQQESVALVSEPIMCTASALDQGGGWGWENEQSCRWPSTEMPTMDENKPVSDGVPPPVTVAAIGFVDGRPICLSDSSDGNEDGFGFENNRTCIVVDGTTATRQSPLLNTRWCQPWAEISYGDYVLQNNTWNEGEVYSNNWHQCIELGGSSANYVAQWDYDWLAQDGGDEFSVKSYPQVYYGRKTGNSISGPADRLGLPAPINQLRSYQVRYKYSETGNAERNVALESFFHTSCEAEEWNKQFEMMVWVGSPQVRTPGPEVAEVDIDGVNWKVHVNPTLDWGYVAFVAAEETNEGWLDWNKFVDWTRFNGPAFGVPSVQDNTCMGAIEIGTETFWGEGTFSLDEFRVVVD